MAGTFPSFKLYQSNGVTLVYNFENALNWGDGPFLDPKEFVTHTSLRGQGEIITEGSDSAWNLDLEFYLTGSDYEDLVAIMESVKTAILLNTNYILKIETTEGGATEDLKVKRLTSIRYPITTNKRKVVTSQKGFITLRVNTWA